MSLFDKTLMIELADALTQQGTPIDEKLMEEVLDPSADDYWDMAQQFKSGVFKTVWSVDDARNYWRPASHHLWNFPYYGFIGTAVGLYQPIPYLVAWMGNHRPWIDMYHKGEDLFSVIGNELKMGRDEGRDAFYRYVYGRPQPQVEIRFPWLAGMREGMRETAASTGYVDTGMGTKYAVTQLDLALGNYLDQVIRDVLRIGTLTLYRDFGYVPCGVFPDSVVVPSAICAAYAEAFQVASRDRFTFSVVMERLGD